MSESTPVRITVSIMTESARRSFLSVHLAAAPRLVHLGALRRAQVFGKWLGRGRVTSADDARQLKLALIVDAAGNGRIFFFVPLSIRASTAPRIRPGRLSVCPSVFGAIASDPRAFEVETHSSGPGGSAHCEIRTTRYTPDARVSVTL
jgi:hypothetical protein